MIWFYVFLPKEGNPVVFPRSQNEWWPTRVRAKFFWLETAAPGGKSEAVGTRHAWAQAFALPVTDCEVGQSYLISPSLTFPICKVRRIACSLKNGCGIRNTVYISLHMIKRQRGSCWVFFEHVISSEESIQGSLIQTHTSPRNKYRHLCSPQF